MILAVVLGIDLGPGGGARKSAREEQQLVKCYNNPGKNGGLTKVVAVKMVRSGYILKEELMVFADKRRYGA